MNIDNNELHHYSLDLICENGTKDLIEFVNGAFTHDVKLSIEKQTNNASDYLVEIVGTDHNTLKFIQDCYDESSDERDLKLFKIS